MELWAVPVLNCRLNVPVKWRAIKPIRVVFHLITNILTVLLCRVSASLDIRMDMESEVGNGKWTIIIFAKANRLLYSSQRKCTFIRLLASARIIFIDCSLLFNGEVSYE